MQNKYSVSFRLGPHSLPGEKWVVVKFSYSNNIAIRDRRRARIGHNLELTKTVLLEKVVARLVGQW